jgi:DNA polymerase III subunit gamma/tau
MAGFAEEQLGNASAAVANYQVSLRVDTSLFDVAVNPFAAWTQLKARVFLESYDTRRARAALPTSEQLEDPDRVIAFFQKSKKGALRAAAAPPPTPEPKTGPVISSAPAASSTAPPSKMSSGPTWNPQGPGTRRREETPPSDTPPPATPPPTTPPPAPAGVGADVGGPGIGGPGVGGPGIGGPGIGGPGIGGPGIGGVKPSPTPTPPQL